MKAFFDFSKQFWKKRILTLSILKSSLSQMSQNLKKIFSRFERAVCVHIRKQASNQRKILISFSTHQLKIGWLT